MRTSQVAGSIFDICEAKSCLIFFQFVVIIGTLDQLVLPFSDLGYSALTTLLFVLDLLAKQLKSRKAHHE
jgi:hypothetical protein